MPSKKTLALIGVVGYLTLNVAQATAYGFPYDEHNVVTMDVVKTYGGGGTWKCASVRDCYIKTLEAEARGAGQYCESATIKRNGKVVWHRRFQ